MCQNKIFITRGPFKDFSIRMIDHNILYHILFKRGLNKVFFFSIKKGKYVVKTQKSKHCLYKQGSWKLVTLVPKVAKLLV